MMRPHTVPSITLYPISSAGDAKGSVNNRNWGTIANAIPPNAPKTKPTAAPEFAAGWSGMMWGEFCSVVMSPLKPTHALTLELIEQPIVPRSRIKFTGYTIAEVCALTVSSARQSY